MSHSGRKPIRLRDVAIRAGVSTASVSRVLNQPESVKLETRNRIEAAMAEMAYVPNWAARALASQRSHTVGAIVPTLGIAIFASGVEALQDRLHELGYTLLLASAQYDIAKELECARVLMERKVDGLVLVGEEHDPAMYRLIEANNIPIVTTYVYNPETKFPSVGIDNAAASRRVVQHLIDLGHREFGVLTSPLSRNDRIRARLEGMLACLAKHGIDLGKDRILEVNYSIQDGRRGFAQLRSRSPAITAVACTTDALAIGSILEAERMGLQIPGDVSITGFDDLELANEIKPGLTTIRVPSKELGARAADLLLAAIGRKQVPDRVELTAELILRGSSSRPPG
jgi:LacI family transcriptional regulator, galactose operon repressor